MVVAQANATLRVSVPAVTSTGVVLASCVIRVQSIDCLGTDTPSDCKSEIGMSHRGGGGSGGKVEATYVGCSVPHRSRFGARHCSRSWKETRLVRQRICRQMNSMFAFHRLIMIESQNPWVGFSISQEEAYGCSLSPMLVCGCLGMIILHPKQGQTILGDYLTVEGNTVDSPELTGICNKNNVVRFLSDL